MKNRRTLRGAFSRHILAFYEPACSILFLEPPPVSWHPSLSLLLYQHLCCGCCRYKNQEFVVFGCGAIIFPAIFAFLASIFISLLPSLCNESAQVLRLMGHLSFFIGSTDGYFGGGGKLGVAWADFLWVLGHTGLQHVSTLCIV